MYCYSNTFEQEVGKWLYMAWLHHPYISSSDTIVGTAFVSHCYLRTSTDDCVECSRAFYAMPLHTPCLCTLSANDMVCLLFVQYHAGGLRAAVNVRVPAIDHDILNNMLLINLYLGTKVI